MKKMMKDKSDNKMAQNKVGMMENDDHEDDDHEHDDDDDKDDFNSYINRSLDWCFKSSPDPQEVVECFQEIIPACRFNEKCKKRMQDFIDKHNLKMDIETGNMYVHDAPYMQKGILDSKRIKGKSLVEFYLNYLQEDNIKEATWWSGDLGSESFIKAFKAFLSNPDNAPRYSSWIQNQIDTAQKSGQVEGIAISVLIAAILTASYVVYKKYLSKAARVCKDYKGMKRKECIVKFEKEAIKAKISSLMKGLSLCNKSKDPVNCKSKLQQKISIERQKLSK